MSIGVTEASNLCDSLLGLVGVESLDSILDHMVEMFLMQISRDVVPRCIVSANKATPYELQGLAWRQLVLILAQHIEDLDRIVLSSRTLEQWEQVAPTSKYPFTITFFDSIGQLHVEGP